MKKTLITGITGQDGSYLEELLLEKGYEVHGIVRRVALENPEHRLWRIRHIRDKIHLHCGSIESYASIYNIVEQVKPDECYHLAAQSFVSYSFEDEFSTLDININGTIYILSAIKNRKSGCKFYFAASSEMFGHAIEPPKKKQLPLIQGLHMEFQRSLVIILQKIIEKHITCLCAVVSVLIMNHQEEVLSL